MSALPTRLRYSLSACCSVAALLAASAGQARQVEPNSESLGEIVVTAQRVQTTLQKAPLAVSAYDSDAIASRQIVDVLTLVRNVPNFSGANNVTLPTAVSLFIRGIGSTDSSISADPPVGLYVDDVVVARQQLNNAGIFDLERVEVLRGPQGTLYGRNTAAGAIKMISNRPVDAFEGWVEAGLGNYSQRMARGVVNVPIIENKLFARGNFAFADRGGLTQNLTTGEKVNDLNSWSFRGALRYLASDTVELNLKADTSKVFSHGTEGVDIAGNYVPATGDLFISHSGNHPRNDGRTHGVNAYVDWAISDTLKFKSISGYRYTFQDYVVDFTDQPIPADINASTSKSHQFTQEFQLSGEFAQKGTFVTGVYAMREVGHQLFGPQTFRNYSRVNGAFPAPGTQNAAQDPAFVYIEDFRLRTTSYAAYAQASYNLTERLKAEAGLRYTYDDKSFVVYAAQGAPGRETFLFDTASVIAATGSPSSKSFSQLTPHFGLNYQFTPNILGYASYTKGFQAGGWFGRVRAPAALVLYDATTVISSEIGLKNTFWNGRARLNADVFVTEQKDLPTSYASLTRPGSFNVASLNPKVWGFEAEAAVKLTSDLTVNGSLGLLDYKYVDLASLPAPVRPNIGADLRFAPKVSGKVGFDYDHKLNETWNIRVGNYYTYTSKQFSNPANTLAGLQPARTLVDASVTLEAQEGKYAITLSCANCGDKHYFGNIIDFGGVRGGALPTSVVYAADPRMWQLMLKAKF